MHVPAPPPTFYVCPGERHAISRSVHWARLAALYDKCRECPHRHDTGLLPPRVTQFPQALSLVARRTLQQLSTGLRGRYLNDLDRESAREWARAYAARLWENLTWVGQNEPEAVTSTAPRLCLGGPCVVVGFDERPASPDIAVGVMTGLRQMGCRVLDVGCVTRPIWKFAWQTFQADGGMFVTGAGCAPAWTGWDVLGVTLPVDMDLETLKVGSQERPTRAAGTVETRSVLAAYRTQLLPWFHALRPLKIVCATPLQLVRELLPPLLEHLPCVLNCKPWPRQPGGNRDAAPGIERLGVWVREHHADVGLLIEEDGSTCHLLDEQGLLVPSAVWQPWLANQIGSHHPEDGVVILGALLQALSLSDAPLSERISKPTS